MYGNRSILTLFFATLCSATISQHIEYIPGNIPLIITTPHGGLNADFPYPARDAGCMMMNAEGEDECTYDHIACEGRKNPEKCGAMNDGQVNENDGNTIPMSKLLDDRIHELTGGGRPFQIINHVHPSFLDPNQEIGLATFQIPEMMGIYEDFHDAVSAARIAVQEEFGAGLLVDMHGDSDQGGDPDKAIQFGYGLTDEQLNDYSDDELKYHFPESTMASLGYRFNDSTTEEDFSSIIRGCYSFGTMAENLNYPSVPSRERPGPGQYKVDHRHGGYIAERHSHNPEWTVDAVQFELPRFIRYDIFDEFVHDFAPVMIFYLNHYYDQDLMGAATPKCGATENAELLDETENVSGRKLLNDNTPHFLPCHPDNNDYSCCTDDHPCDWGQGDCNHNSQCAGDLVCRYDGWSKIYPQIDACGYPDICHWSVFNKWTCCSPQHQCIVGEGDCDADIDCFGDLVCKHDDPDNECSGHHEFSDSETDPGFDCCGLP